MTTTYRATVTVPDQGVSQICYAACFIDAAVEAVEVVDGAFTLTLSEAVDPDKIEAGLVQLCDRFAGLVDEGELPIFINPLPNNHMFFEEALDKISKPIAPGLMSFHGIGSELLRFLDWAALKTFASPLGASEEIYPNVIPIETLAKTGHFSSFPEHVNFINHLREDLDVLGNFAARAKTESVQIKPEVHELAEGSLVHNPATCYHCYAAREGQSLDADTVVTAVTNCHRFESGNHRQTGRLMEFTLREVIFLGTPDFVKGKRQAVIDMVRDWTQRWKLFGEFVSANDPFFTSDFGPKAQQQRRLAMKYEYCAAVGHDAKIAVLSSNLHGPTFAKAFAIRQDGRLINTACLGFGLERLAIAIMIQHGLDPAAWPQGLQDDFTEWNSVKPLA